MARTPAQRLLLRSAGESRPTPTKRIILGCGLQNYPSARLPPRRAGVPESFKARRLETLKQLLAHVGYHGEEDHKRLCLERAQPRAPPAI
jgi:hypothetical protein